MKLSIRKSLVGLLVASLASCTATVDTGVGPGAGGTGPGPATGSGGGGPGPVTGTGGGGPGPVTGTGGGGPGPVTGTGGGGGPVTGTGGATPSTSIPCVPGVPATSQVPRMTVLQYETVVKDLLGVTTLATNGNSLPGALLSPDSSGALTDIGWNGYLMAAEKIAAEVMASATNKTKFIACDPAAAGAAGTTCLTDTITAFGRKAFRRPLTAAEVTSFMRFNSLTPKGTPAEVAEAILFGILASPSFIARPELAQDKEGTATKLNSYEVAARLSFLLWNSVPDDTLNAEANAGRLITKEQIRPQAMRLLQSPKAAAVASSFHRFYADIATGSHWVNQTMHNATKFPAFVPASYTAAMAEMDAFFQDIVVSGGTFKDLFTSPVGFVTKDTAALYGVTSTATTPTKMMLDATRRPGFLTRVGFLSTFSHEDTSSPILRGAFISGRVLGIPTGTPDPTVLGAKPMGTFTTNRAAMEALTMPAPCNACHTTRINPPGFVLERFNAVGTWQDTDALGGAINSTAEVIFSANPEVKKSVSTPAELMAEIAQTPGAQRNYAGYWVAYATARGANANDACIVDQLAGSLVTPTYSIASMMADYTQVDSFRLRTVGN